MTFTVIAEIFVSRRRQVRRDAQQASQALAVVIIGPPVGERERGDEQVVGPQTRINERRQHPKLEERVVGPVGSPGQIRSYLLCQGSCHPPMAGVNMACGLIGLGGFAEGDIGHRPQGAVQPPQRVAPEMAVPDDAGGHERVRELQQQSARPGERRQPLPVDPPENRLRREEWGRYFAGVMGEVQHRAGASLFGE